MLAYKFLAPGAIAPFTLRPWPLPEPRAPGAWLEAPPGDLPRRGVHACRTEDLSLWPEDELWLVELRGPFAPLPHQVVAARGRLLRRVRAWDGQAAVAYAGACAWRARDLVAAALDACDFGVEAAALRACTGLSSLQECASTIADATAQGRETATREPDRRGLVAYAAGAAMRAGQGRFREAALQNAHLAAALAGSEDGAAAERAWQSGWLAERLELEKAARRALELLEW